MSKNRLGRQRCPKGRHPRFELTLLDTFWSQVSWLFMYFYQKVVCFTHVSFFHEFWVALSALWDRLTCNPSTYMQSKHTFQFLHFFLKSLSEDLQMRHFLSHFWPNMWFLCEKNGSKNCFKKRCPSSLKLRPIPMPGGSRRGSLACALYKQKTVVRATVEALFEIFAEKSGLGSKLVWKTDWTAE